MTHFDFKSYLGDYNTEIVDIYDGTAGSPCFNPCLTTKVKITRGGKFNVIFSYLGSWIHGCK